jgi:hypothetical protein
VHSYNPLASTVRMFHWYFIHTMAPTACGTWPVEIIGWFEVASRFLVEVDAHLFLSTAGGILILDPC